MPAEDSDGRVLDLENKVRTLQKQNEELMEKLEKAMEGRDGKSDSTTKELASQAQFYKKKLDEKDKEIETLQKVLKKANESSSGGSGYYAPNAQHYLQIH